MNRGIVLMKRKALKGMILAAALAVFSGMTSLAMGWQMDDTGWWWLREDGTWLANTWAWIDGDGDGTAECYYFDQNGYMLASTTTPDGYTVDANGARTVDGAVQTQTAGGSTGSGSELSYDNETNRQALAAYANALVNDASLQSTSYWGQKTSFNLADLNSDGVYEMAVYVPGESNAETAYYICWYSNGKFHKDGVMMGHLYYQPETGDCMADYYHMGVAVQYYHFDGNSFVTTADEYFYLVDFEIELYADSPEANKAIAEKHDSFINNSLSVDLVEANSDNIAKYLG